MKLSKPFRTACWALIPFTLFLLAFSAVASGKSDDGDLGETTKLILAGAAYFVWQFINNAWNNSKAKQIGKAVVESAVKPDDIVRLESNFKKEMSEMEERIKKETADIRFQLKTVIAAMHDEMGKIRDNVKEGLDKMSNWMKVSRPPTDAGTKVPGDKS